jgi:chromosome segregation ATPase
VCLLVSPQEASKQLKVLQQELKAFVEDSQEHRSKKEAAERRCAELEGLCSDAERRAGELAPRLAAAEEACAAAEADAAALRRELEEARLAAAQLEAQSETFQSVQQVKLGVFVF